MSQLNLPKGRRLTRQRQVILAELRKVHSHPNAFEVYELVKKKIPRISLGTVYRNLGFLKSHGHIQALSCDCCDCEHFDGQTDHNEHFTCKLCQRVYDLKGPLTKKICLGSQDGHQIDNYQVNLIGICHQCLKKKKSSSARKSGLTGKR